MRFPCTIELKSDGLWHARHTGPDLATVETTAATRSEALEKIKGEIRYRLELCPCSGESYRHIEIELVEPAQGGIVS